MLGGEKLPIYQPGTIMFESAAIEDSNIAIYQNSVQQNGPVLSSSGAVFLARFLVTLVLKYEHLASQTSQNSQKIRQHLDTQVCKLALEKVLKDFSIEDVRQHGRLLTLKSNIVRQIFPNDKLDIKTLALF